MADAVPLMAIPSALAGTAPDGDGAEPLVFTRAHARLIMTAIQVHAQSLLKLKLAT